MRFRVLGGLLGLAALWSAVLQPNAGPLERWAVLVLWVVCGGAAQIAARYTLALRIRTLPGPWWVRFFTGTLALWSLLVTQRTVLGGPAEAVLHEALTLGICLPFAAMALRHRHLSPAALGFSLGAVLALSRWAWGDTTAWSLALDTLCGFLLVWVPARAFREIW